MRAVNKLIERIFDGFTVDGVKIPVKFMNYFGHGEPYVTYLEMSLDNTFNADNMLQAYEAYYYFDVYSTSNFEPILNAVRSRLEYYGFSWQPTQTSSDMYDPDTGYYHKTLCFSFLVNESE